MRNVNNIVIQGTSSYSLNGMLSLNGGEIYNDGSIEVNGSSTNSRNKGMLVTGNGGTGINANQITVNDNQIGMYGTSGTTTALVNVADVNSPVIPPIDVLLLFEQTAVIVP